MKSIFSFFFVVKAIWVRWYHNLWNSFPVEFPGFLLGDQIDHRKEPTNERLLKEDEKIVKFRVTRKVRLKLELKLLWIIKSLWICMFRNNHEVYRPKEVLHRPSLPGTFHIFMENFPISLSYFTTELLSKNLIRL